MRVTIIITAGAALAPGAGCAFGEWIYEGQFGSFGRGNGQFWWPADVDVGAGGDRLYVSDNGNNRVQYFKRDNPAVTPASLGRVKALFK
jgi:hypothetical protein